MIPVQLKIKGLYSYQQEQVIDFTRLTAAHLFGIFGHVGSGKSSVIEAITFALYGKTDRLNLSGDNRNYNMMNLKSDEMLIEFRFDAGKEAYMSVVSARRNSKKHDDVKKAERMLYQQIDGKWKPIDVERIEEIIGLSYDNFKRTIIIPQGRFQEFLQLGDKDRTQMMKELFKLEKFELWHKAVALDSDNNTKIAELKGQLAGVGEVSPEMLQESENRLKELESALSLKDAALKLAEAELLGWQKLEERWKEMLTLKQKQAVLKQREPEMVALTSMISKAEYCREHFKPLMDDLLKEVEAKKQSEQNLISANNSYQNQLLQLDELAKKLKENEASFAGIEKLKEKGEELQLLLKILSARGKIKENESRVTKGSHLVDNGQEKLSKLKSERQALALKKAEQESSLPDTAQVLAVRDWHKQQEILLIEALELQKQSDELRKERDELGLAFNSVIKDYSLSLQDDNQTRKNAEIRLTELKTECDENLKKLDIDIEQLKVSKKLEEFAQHLHIGEPCPLCGSKEHPHKYTNEEVKNQLDALLQQRSIVVEQIRKIEADLKLLHGNQLQWDDKSGRLQKIAERQIANEAAKDKHLTLFVWDLYKGKSAKEMDELLTLTEKKRTELKEISRLIEQNQAETDKMQNELERFKLALESLKSESREQEVMAQTLLAQLKQVKEEDYAEKGLPAIIAEAQQCQVEYQRVIENQEKLNLQLKEVQSGADTQKGMVSALNEQLNLLEQKISAVQRQLDATLKSSDYTSVEEIQSAINAVPNISASRDIVQQFRQEVYMISQKLESVVAEIGEKEYNEELHKAEQERSSQFKKEFLELTEARTTAQNLLKSFRDKLEKTGQLQQQLSSLEKRAENLALMKKLFKASGFVNYASSVHLQQLCNLANKRFYKMTGQSLQLELNAENNFEVRDFMNGGKLRSVKTLSGGQTFQAALSLALALADNLHQSTISDRNFFFLDEGFGSLDKEALRTVFETLKGLQKENRTVGIISHVEELQQEIPVYIRVENDGESGSRIVVG